MSQSPESTQADANHSHSHAEIQSAFWSGKAHLRLWIVAAVGLTVDLWTKHLAFSQLPPGERGHVVIPSLMRLQRSLNRGALFGLGKGLTPLFIGASLLALLFVLYLFFHSDRKRVSLHVALGLVLAGALGNLHDRAFCVVDVVRFYPQGQENPPRVIEGVVLDQAERAWIVAPWPEGKDAPPETFQRIPTSMNPETKSLGVVRDFIRMEPVITLGDKRIPIWPWVFNIADALLVVGVAVLMLNFWWERRQELKACEASSQPDQQTEDNSKDDQATEGPQAR